MDRHPTVSPYLLRPIRTLEQAIRDRCNLRAWRRALGLCPDCRDLTPAGKETGFCERHTTERHYGGDVIDLDAERKFREVERVMEGE